MAVTLVKALWVGRRGKDDIDRHRTYTSRYEVQTDDAADDPTVSGGTSLLPRLGDQYPNDSAAICIAVVPEQLDESPYLWHVDIEYDTELPKRQGAEAQGHDTSGNATTKTDPDTRPENPLDRDPIWVTDSEDYEEPFIRDANGDAVVNSAGDPYDPPLMTKRRIWVVHLTKNVASLDFSDILTYSETTNDDTWRGIPRGELLVMPIHKSTKKENGLAFTEVNVTIKWKRGGWRRFVVDQGTRTLVSDGLGGYTKSEILDTETGLGTTKPWLLDGSGALLDPGLDAVFFPTDGYQEFDESNFDDLMTVLGIT